MNTKTSNYEPHNVPNTRPGGNEVRYVPHTPPWSSPELTWEKRRNRELWDALEAKRLLEKGLIQ